MRRENTNCGPRNISIGFFTGVDVWVGRCAREILFVGSEKYSNRGGKNCHLHRFTLESLLAALWINVRPFGLAV
jgi:hypothetical protein